MATDAPPPAFKWMPIDGPVPTFKWEWEGDAHKPLDGSIQAFKEIEGELKAELKKVRRDREKHAPGYFASVQNLSDEQLTKFSADNFVQVRVASAINGNKTLFGKVNIPESGSGYIHFRAHVSGEGAQLHSIHTELNTEADENNKEKAIFSEKDELKYFDT